MEIPPERNEYPLVKPARFNTIRNVKFDMEIPLNEMSEGEESTASSCLVLNFEGQPPTPLKSAEIALLRQLSGEQVDIRGNPPRTVRGDTALHVAAREGHLMAAIVLLASGAEPNAVGHGQRTPLLNAIDGDHLTIVQRLLVTGADEDLATALSLAARRRNMEVIRLLLERGGQPDCSVCLAILTHGDNSLNKLFLEKVPLHAFEEEGLILLVHAARLKRWEVVKMLLEKGESATICENNSECALVMASEDGQADIVQQILRHGAASNEEQVKRALGKAKSAAVVEAFVQLVPDDVKSSSGSYGLIAAGRDGRLEPLVALLKAGVDVNARDELDRTALHWAAAKRQMKCLRELLRRGADAKAKASNGHTPLHWASRGGNLDVLVALVKAGADVNAKGEGNQTALIFAAQTGHSACVKELLRRGADPNAKDKDGDTPLHWASRYNRQECQAILLKAGVHINTKNYKNQTPLMLAVQNVQFDWVMEFLQRGAHADVKDEDGCTPLHYASKYGRLESMGALIKAGVDVHARNCVNRSALHLAAEAGHLPCVKELLERGADSNTKDNDGNTPLHLASLNGHLETLVRLLDAGVDIEARNGKNMTALHLAGENWREPCQKELLRRGADPNAKDENGRTPVLYAWRCSPVYESSEESSEPSEENHSPLHSGASRRRVIWRSSCSEAHVLVQRAT